MTADYAVRVSSHARRVRLYIYTFTHVLTTCSLVVVLVVKLHVQVHALVVAVRLGRGLGRLRYGRLRAIDDWLRLLGGGFDDG